MRRTRVGRRLCIRIDGSGVSRIPTTDVAGGGLLPPPLRSGGLAARHPSHLPLRLKDRVSDATHTFGVMLVRRPCVGEPLERRSLSS
jgi:hypothetical protein